MNRSFCVVPLLALFTACATEPGLDRSAAPRASTERVQLTDTTTTCVDLMAGQFTDAGDVCMSIDASTDSLVFTYTTTDGWELTETHLWVGTSLAAMPQTRTGNPKVGNFPYQSGDITGATTWSASIPLSTFGLSYDDTTCDPVQFFAAAHAAVQKPNGDGSYQTETGWGDGDGLTDKGSWAMYFSGTLECVEDDVVDPEPEVCETAFAYAGADGTCFSDIDPDIKRWGWSNGPLSEGSYTWDVYAGAGQCDTSKGTLVGSVTVDYSGGVATVTYTTLAGYYTNETHLYVGNDVLASNNGEYTVAPGQYPYIHDLDGATSDTYTVSGLSGDIYVVHHSVTCGF